MSSSKSSQPILGFIFDGDDTLWNTECLYDKARAKARRIVENAGIDGSRWEQLERQIDVRIVVTFGFSAERFPTSCVQAYEQLARECGLPTNLRIVEGVRKAASTVFERKPRVAYRARKTLEYLRDSGQKLALLTKGDPEVQKKRIATSGLGEFFDLVEIVPEKSPEIIRDVIARLGVEAPFACMVGNSLRSDILPAVEAGLQAIWIDAHVWEYERVCNHSAHDKFTSLSQLADIKDLFHGGVSA